MPNSRHTSVIASPSSRRATKRRRSSITELAFHGINTSRQKAKSVTHVSGTKCHLCLRPLNTARRYLVERGRSGTHAEILLAAADSPRRSSNANSLRNSFLAKSPPIPAATLADFDPDGFRSSSPTTPDGVLGLLPLC